MGDKLWGSLKPIIEDTNDEKEKEKLIKILMPCIIELLIKPRYKWIALIGFLFKAIKDSDKYERPRLELAEKEINDWVMRGDNRFTSFKGVPEPIDNILRNNLGINFVPLITEYQDNIPKPTSDIMNKRVEELVRAWEFPETREKIVDKKPVKRRKASETSNLYRTGYKESQHSMPMGSKTYIDTENLEGKELSKAQRLIEMKDKIDIQYIDSKPEIIKQDEKRFTELFKAFNDENIEITDNEKMLIEHVWFGNYYGPKTGHDNFIDYSDTHKIGIKVSGGDIPSVASRLILQAFIIGIVMKVNLKTIYRMVIEVSREMYPDYTGKPSHVWEKTGYVPNKEVECIISPILKDMDLNPALSFMRQNWKEMRFPEINVSKLITFIDDSKLPDDEKYKAKSSVYVTHNKVKDTKGLSKGKFAKMIKESFAKKKLGKVNKSLTNNKIIGLLFYAGSE